ncbi:MULTISPECIES: restriction endonuclease subunit S [Pseudomonas]|uniref:restriction endonuclease subunit S n=1 Tax=Pseudomonas TaxID=286 RepID=UPI000C2A006B|nr:MULTISPECIES: restriction endonuclease subunit S [Pseudomonas]MBH3383321.1 restriction endonuclease subunit S [Pseudomonas juntendi]MCE0906360.1 restriction endonuclease subunit S [Pseudomonas alloputida]PJX11956.1 restriction endonuclease [Pseudomonas putida]
MTALLTENLPLLAGAPNGIKKLRELILELAVRGKLVPQDPSDEPASELLTRIAEGKARLVAEGKIKKQKALAEIGEEEKPFNVPTNWEWIRLGQLGSVSSSSRVHQKDWQSSGVPFYRAREIVRLSRDGFVENELFISEKLYQELSTGESVPTPGDIMLTGVGTIGVPYCVQKTDRFYFKDASVLIFKNHVAENSSYLLKYFISPFWVDTIHAESMGTTVHTLTIARANETLCPLPPLAEQHRIVTKVDELMTLCDRLEAQQADAASAHAQLVQALLDSLTQASDATDFAANWQRLAEHFHTLFTTEPSVDALKQTLLQLAVMGKLVPQSPSDEPASELLKRIAQEKARLVAEGKLKKQKPLTEIAEMEKTFELPESWEFVRLEEIAQVGTGATPLRTNPKYFEPATINWVTSGETSQDHIHETAQKVSPLALTETNLTVYPPHTLVIAMYGQGKTRGQISELLIDACTNQACAAIQLFDQDESHRRYVKYFFIKSYDDIRLLAAGGAQPNLNLGKIKETVLPLPPAAEQHRIVAKVDQLMALCEQLKTRLAQARQLNEQLASTLVEQAVA